MLSTRERWTGVHLRSQAQYRYCLFLFWTLFAISRSDCGVLLEMIPGELQGWPGGSTVIHRRGSDDRQVVGLETFGKLPFCVNGWTVTGV